MMWRANLESPSNCAAATAAAAAAMDVVGAKRAYPFGHNSEPLRKSHLSDKENMFLRDRDALSRAEADTVRRLFAAERRFGGTPARRASAPSETTQTLKRVTFALGQEGEAAGADRAERKAPLRSSPRRPSPCVSCLRRRPALVGTCDSCAGAVCAACIGACGRCAALSCINCCFPWDSDRDGPEAQGPFRTIYCGNCWSIME